MGGDVIPNQYPIVDYFNIITKQGMQRLLRVFESIELVCIFSLGPPFFGGHVSNTVAIIYSHIPLFLEIGY